jgi:nucleoside phosphorylase
MHNDYTIGVVCALPLEKAAVVAMLDEEHDALTPIEGDENSYTLGRIGVHNIVVACLPAGMTGNNSAATVANDMKRSYQIKVGLMIGVGGGVWSPGTDIRLGDVVVSKPDKTHGGVVQWDFGKMEQGGNFHRTGSLNKPPRVLLNALSDLQVRHWRQGSKLVEYHSAMLANEPSMVDEFGHQGTDNDVLFQAAYPHRHGETCKACDREMAVQRKSRSDLAPAIHYGNIASGNEVMKDGATRDKIASREGIICFDMEAAGLMDTFPCLVIRGICDYADSHKNKRWQPYAAATAAAFAKELLGFINKHEVEKTSPASKSKSSTVTVCPAPLPLLISRQPLGSR